ncbi:MAG: response regulator transcription factor [Acidimicrobiia bacterium]
MSDRRVPPRAEGRRSKRTTGGGAGDPIRGPEAHVRVVIADDEPDVRLLLRVQLEREGFVVTGEAADGIEAIEVCGWVDVDAVVLDLLMPGMTGFEAIPRLRRAQPDLAIVAYTAVAGDYVRREMARLAVPLVLKSGDIAPLAAALRRSVEAARGSEASE